MKFQLISRIHPFRWLRRRKAKKTKTTDPCTTKREPVLEEITTWPELRDFLSPYFANSDLDDNLKGAIAQFLVDTTRMITCIEPILTTERWNIFKQKLEEILNINPTAHPYLSYHGTRETNLRSIIQDGFLVPDGISHVSAHGCMYGKGIYSSPEINIAAGYGTQVILCAIATAKPYVCHWYDGSDVAKKAGFDSNRCGGDGRFWLMFGCEQVLPLCVIHQGEFQSSSHKRTLAVVKLWKAIEKGWKGMSDPKGFQYQKFREVKVRTPVI